MVNENVSSNRPYTPPSNVIAILQRLRSRNLPDHIDAEYLRDASIPEGTISRTLFALKFLGLLNEDGLLNEPLKAMHTATDEEYRTILSGLIRESYKEVFTVVDPSQDSQDKILNVFRRYTPASQRDRMVIFFLGMCREAGIPTLDVPKARTMGEKVVKPEKKTTGVRSVAPQRKNRLENNQYSFTGVNPALEGLIKSLPKPGEALSKERREQWIHMAEATLAFLYPEKIDNIVSMSEEDVLPQN